MSTCKYLGVILDPQLKWHHHIEHVSKKVIRNLFLFRKARPYVDLDTARLLYFTIIQSHLEYCSVIWSNAAKYVLNKLRVLQNRAVRILIKALPEMRTLEIYDLAKLSNIDKRWKRANLITLFKIIHNLAPVYLSSRTEVANNPYNLRNCNYKLKLPKPKTEFLRRSFIYRATTNFNSLPSEIRNIFDVKIFIRALQYNI